MLTVTLENKGPLQEKEKHSLVIVKHKASKNDLFQTFLLLLNQIQESKTEPVQA
jgi:hypothetical protein